MQPFCLSHGNQLIQGRGFHVARARESRIKMAESIGHCQIPNITANYQYVFANGTVNETIVEEYRRIFLPRPALAVTDEQGETLHRQDGASLIIVMALLVLTIITIWVFRAWRIRVCHSTGLAMLYGKGLLEVRGCWNTHQRKQGEIAGITSYCTTYEA